MEEIEDDGLDIKTKNIEELKKFILNKSKNFSIEEILRIESLAIKYQKEDEDFKSNKT